MNATKPAPIRRVPWITQEDLDISTERIKNMTPAEMHQSLIDADIIDEKGEWVDHPYGAMGYGPMAEHAG